VFFPCTLLPFVAVMAANYLFPVYVSQTLAAGPEWFAGGEITFAAGAILAGLLLPRLISRHSATATVPITMLVFLGGLLLLAAVDLPLPYLCAGALLGFGNAGCRVARSALLLHLVPTTVMGRVGGFFQVLDRVLRTALVLAMEIIDAHGPPVGFALLAVLLLLALAGELRTRAAARPVAPA